MFHHGTTLFQSDFSSKCVTAYLMYKFLFFFQNSPEEKHIKAGDLVSSWFKKPINALYRAVYYIQSQCYCID